MDACDHVYEDGTGLCLKCRGKSPIATLERSIPEAEPLPPRPKLPERPEIVCICGSSRFVAEMAIQAWELEKQGKIALGINLLPASYRPPEGLHDHHQAEAEGVKEILDTLHLRKIDQADRVLVMNIDGYIGDSTRDEIEYAARTGKPIEYWDGPAPT